MSRSGLSALLILVVFAAGGYVVYQQVQKFRAKQNLAQSQREWKARAYSQEIVCDNCGEITTGLSLSRNEASRFQECPKCHQMTGRPIVYYKCMNPACNGHLIKVRASVTIGDTAEMSQGDRIECDLCGSNRSVSPDAIDLENAKKKAKETGQEFP